MSWVTDFDKLHITTKSAVLSIVALIPFWFVSIYLFNKPLYNQHDMFIIGAFCFCFSLTYYALIVFLGLLILQIADDKNENDEMVLIIGGIISVLYLCVVIVVSYYFDWCFTTFLLVAYLYLVGRMIFTSIILLIAFYHDSKDKKDNKEETPTVE